MKKLITGVVIAAAAVVLFTIVSRSDTDNNEVITDNNSIDMTGDIITLPQPSLSGTLSLEEAIARRRSVRSYRPDALNIGQVGQMLWSAQGITLESRGFRAAPSAGATFPLEIYLAAGRVNRLAPGLYRYNPSDHTLSLVTDEDLRSQLSAAALGQHMVRDAPVSFIIAADYGRTSSRYGERAVRYVHMEVGHAAQNLNLQAISLGFGAVMVGAFNDSDVKGIMELPDNIDPLYIIPVGRPQQ